MSHSAVRVKLSPMFAVTFEPLCVPQDLSASRSISASLISLCAVMSARTVLMFSLKFVVYFCGLCRNMRSESICEPEKRETRFPICRENGLSNSSTELSSPPSLI